MDKFEVEKCPQEIAEALYEQAKDTIAFIGPENMRLGLEV